MDVKTNTDNFKQEYGNIVVFGHDDWYVTGKEIEIYENNTLIGTVNRKGIWQYKVNNDTKLVFKIGTKEADVKVRCDTNNEIKLFYGSDLKAKITYTDSKFSIDKHNKELQHDKFSKTLTYKYYGIQFRKVLYIILFFLSWFINDSYLQTILFFGSLIAIIIHTNKFNNTKWKHLAGPRSLYINQVYEVLIMTKLIPKLHQEFNYYGIKMTQRPIEDDPGKQTYIGHDKDNNSIKFKFYIAHEDMVNINKYKYPMLLKFSYKNFYNETIGEIDLSNNTNIDATIKLIIDTLKEKELIKGGEEIMNTYSVKYYIGTSSSTTTVETVTANSEYNAKQLIINKYPNQEVHILNVTKN